eukprot:TRINITY_DN542_c1_g6_i1.p1 TRINITY_DN542_c1_g6~~TRINITY_DN542_c1_g6_i1.p1  ORF type:complete len:1380 (+),score=192.23 TRINITY_DN542_c1_g6_i1:45-4142(+)
MLVAWWISCVSVVHPSGKLQLLGSGSTALSNVVRDWSVQYNAATGTVNATYDATGSGVGLQRVSRNESFWSVSEAALSDSDSAFYPGIQMMPLVVMPVAVIFNLDQGTALTLDRATLARIFSLDVSWWNDTRIRSLNPQAQLPNQLIDVVVRADSSGTSEILTKSLSGFGWLDTPGCRTATTPCTVTTELAGVRPGGNEFTSRAGSRGISDYVKTHRWSIGYIGVESAIEHRHNLAAVVNKLGLPTLPSRSYADISAADFNDRFVGTAYDQGGYPLLGIAYAVYWREFVSGSQFDGVTDEFRGYTKDYLIETRKASQNQSGNVVGNNWGYPADFPVHLPPKTCSDVAQTAEFLYWLLTSPDSERIVLERRLVVVPQSLRGRLLPLVWSSVCDGQPWGRTPPIQIAASTETQRTMQSLAFSYHRGNPGYILEVVERPTTAAPLLVAPSAKMPAGFQVFPFSAEATLLTFNQGIRGLQTTLELSLDTIRMMFTGQISLWNDPRVLSVNPFLPLRNATISIVGFGGLLDQVLDQLNLSALGANVPYTDLGTESAVVQAIQGSNDFLGLLPLHTADQWELSRVLPTGHGGNLEPTTQSVDLEVKRLMFSDDFRTVDRKEMLHGYPFLNLMWIGLSADRDGLSEERAEVMTEAVKMARWLTGASPHAIERGSTVSTHFREHSIAYLSWTEDAQNRIDRAFERITVNGKAVFAEPTNAGSALWMWLLVGGGGFLVLVSAGFLIKMRRDVNKIQRLVSDKQVAEEAATAIAEMRLEDLDYLSQVQKPTPIQLAFANIVETLMEYRTFLPGHLLEQARAQAKSPPPIGFVVIVFTDIQSSTMLWDTVPEGMDAALIEHNNILRRNANRNSGYEVKTIGDAFMLAFSSVTPAMRCCLQSQLDLFNAPLTVGLADVEITRQQGHWRGLRVRMGVHCGAASDETNPVTGRTDYRGPVVNMASRLEAHGRGGAVSVSAAVHSLVDRRELLGGKVAMRSAGEMMLRGFRDAQEVFFYVPQVLSGRLDGRVSHSTPSSRSASPFDRCTRFSLHSRLSCVTPNSLLRGFFVDDEESLTLSCRSEAEVAMEPKKLDFQKTLASRDSSICVASLNFSSEQTVRICARAAVQVYSKVLSVSIELVRRFAGTVLTVDGGDIRWGWSLFQAVPCHRQHAPKFALTFSNRLSCGAEDISLGVASGTTLSGYVSSAAPAGGARARHHIAFGAPCAAAHALSSFSKSVGLPVLTTDFGRPAKDCSRLVDRWAFKSDTTIEIRQPLPSMLTESISFETVSPSSRDVDGDHLMQAVIAQDACAHARLSEAARQRGSGDLCKILQLHTLPRMPRCIPREPFTIATGVDLVDSVQSRSTPPSFDAEGADPQG